MQFGLSFQKNKSNWYILFAVLASLPTYFTDVVSQSPVVNSFITQFTILPQIVMWGLIAILLCSRRTTIQAVEMAIVLLAIGIMGTINSSHHLLLLFLFAFASLDIDFSKLIKVDLIVRMAVILFASLLTAVGMATDVLIYRTDNLGGVSIVRHSLGFIHPNTLMVMVLLVLLEWIYLRFRRLTWWEVLVLVGVALGYNYLTNSRTSTMLALMGIIGVYALQLLAVHASDKVNNGVRRVLNWLLLICVPVLAILDIAIMYLPSNSGLFMKLNGFLANRVAIGQYYLQQTGITWLGGHITSNYVQDGVAYGIDSSYVYQVVFYGLIVLLAFIWIMQRSITHMVKIGATDVAYIFALTALLAVTEAVANNMGENIVVFGMLAFVGYDRLNSIEFNQLNQFEFTRQYGEI